MEMFLDILFVNPKVINNFVVHLQPFAAGVTTDFFPFIGHEVFFYVVYHCRMQDSGSTLSEYVLITRIFERK